jgi:hypothetical protein
VTQGEAETSGDGRGTMQDGFYTITYVGVAGMGLAVVLMEKGIIRGFDLRGGKYDGIYSRDFDGTVELSLRLAVIAGGELVTGEIPPPAVVKLPITARLPADVANGNPVVIMVGDRQVRATFAFVRPPRRSTVSD